jgi:hypothetical protein
LRKVLRSAAAPTRVRPVLPDPLTVTPVVEPTTFKAALDGPEATERRSFKVPEPDTADGNVTLPPDDATVNVAGRFRPGAATVVALPPVTPSAIPDRLDCAVAAD